VRGFRAVSAAALRLGCVLLGLDWLRGQDLNLRPSGYEPDELPGCSTPRRGVFALVFFPADADVARSGQEWPEGVVIVRGKSLSLAGPATTYSPGS
jgi:hypothetical protein